MRGGSEGVAVAAANGVGGDELRSGREGERAEERMSSVVSMVEMFEM